MAKKKMVKEVEVKEAETEESIVQKIQLAAFLDWRDATQGKPVDEEQTNRFWLEAERRIKGE